MEQFAIKDSDLENKYPNLANQIPLLPTILWFPFCYTAIIFAIPIAFFTWLEKLIIPLWPQYYIFRVEFSRPD